MKTTEIEAKKIANKILEEIGRTVVRNNLSRSEVRKLVRLKTQREGLNEISNICERYNLGSNNVGGKGVA